MWANNRVELLPALAPLRMRLQTKGLLLVAGATFFWSLSGVFVRTMPGTDPWTFNAWRGLGMAVSLVIWTVLHHGQGAVALFR